MVLPNVLLEKWKKKRYNETQPCSPLLQQALGKFIQKGEFERHIKRMRKVYERKYTFLIQCIKRYMGNKVEIIGEKAGLHLLIRIALKNEAILLSEAEKIGINVYSTKPYFAEERASYPLLLGFGGLKEKEIEEGIINLADAWFM